MAGTPLTITPAPACVLDKRGLVGWSDGTADCRLLAGIIVDTVTGDEEDATVAGIAIEWSRGGKIGSGQTIVNPSAGGGWSSDAIATDLARLARLQRALE